MVRVESAENWPGMKNSQCEVVGGEKKWDGETSLLVLSVLKSQYELAETTFLQPLKSSALKMLEL